jgi:ketosteroid isomerase-like protein
VGDDAEIRVLSDRYAAAVDGRDVDALLAVFAPDACLVRRPDGDGTPGFELVGHDALRGVIRQLARSYRSTSHVLGARDYDVASASATGEVSCTAHHLREGDGGEVIDRVLHVRYLDTYARVDRGWLITRRELRVDRTEERVVDPGRD